MNDNTIMTNLDGDGIFTITFNRPEKKNAINNAMWLGLRDAFRQAREDDDVIVIVLTGAGEDFSAGVDFSSFEGSDSEPHPFDLCLDEVYVGESVRLRFPFASLGLVTEFAASYLIPLTLGRQNAAELLFTAEWIDARLAVETGIARRAYPDDELLARTMERARAMAQWPPFALREIKRLLKLPHTAGIEAARAAEFEGMRRLAGSPENIEAITAFMEKRKPDFKKLRKQGS
ncbi:MAG: enoyl-CoA hydratase [Chloroflexi bacterium]|nr:enoyl-CoA hydratase [Chloroflexota bacterium]